MQEQRDVAEEGSHLHAKERRSTDDSLMALRGTNPACTWVLDFQPLELGDISV